MVVVSAPSPSAALAFGEEVVGGDLVMALAFAFVVLGALETFSGGAAADVSASTACLAAARLRGDLRVAVTALGSPLPMLLVASSSLAAALGAMMLSPV